MPRRRKTTRKTGPASCQHCRARIVFVRMTETGKAVPVDPIPVDDGNVCARALPGGLVGYVISAAHPAQAGYTRYMTHHATCDARERPAPRPKPEPAPTLFDEPDTCRLVEVDGEVIRVHGSGDMDETDRQHFAEIVRAAKRLHERNNP